MKKLLLSIMSLAPLVSTSLGVTSCGSKFDRLSFNVSEWDTKKIFDDAKVYQAIAANKDGVVIPGSDGVLIRPNENDKTKIDSPNSFTALSHAWEDGEVGLWQYVQLRYMVPSMIYYYEKQTNDGKNGLITIDKITKNFDITYTSQDYSSGTTSTGDSKYPSDVPSVYNVGDKGYPDIELTLPEDQQGPVATYKWSSGSMGSTAEFFTAAFQFTLSIKDPVADEKHVLYSPDGYYFGDATKPTLQMTIGFYASDSAFNTGW